jgi:hypothetical protein
VTPNYRALALATDHIRGCGLFGQMECEINLGFASETYINCEDFLQLLRSLPDEELEVEVDAAKLTYKCGRVSGHLSLMAASGESLIINRPRFNNERVPNDVVETPFGAGLELGALSCGSMALRTLGLQGVQIKNKDGKAYAYATDDTTLSSCYLGNALEVPPPIDGANEPVDTITLLPEAVDLLAALIKRDGMAIMIYDGSSVYCETHGTKLLLHQVPALRLDVSTILDDLTSCEIRLPINQQAVAAFIKRAEALSEATARAMVEVSVEDGNTKLVFNEATSSSQEFHLTQGSRVADVPPVKIEAHRLAKALAHSKELVFDYAAQHILILRGDNEFVFAIMGKRDAPTS